jgi:hypothetical protein
MHSPSPPFALHALPISSSLTWSFSLYLTESTSYEAPHYAVYLRRLKFENFSRRLNYFSLFLDNIHCNLLAENDFTAELINPLFLIFRFLVPHIRYQWIIFLKVLQIHGIKKSISDILLITMNSALLYNFREYPGFPLNNFLLPQEGRTREITDVRVYNTFNLLHMVLRNSHLRHIRKWWRTKTNLCVLMIFLHTKFCMHSYNGALINAIKLEYIHRAAMLFLFLQKIALKIIVYL